MSFTSTDPASKKGKSDTWLTPLDIISRLSTDGFDLDPCGYDGHNTARKIITLPQDGLKYKWHGKVWLNPPYSDAEPWLRRLSEHGCGVALMFSRTGTSYMQGILRAATCVQFIKGRISFIKPGVEKSNNAGADSMAIFFGCEPVDTSLGVVLK